MPMRPAAPPSPSHAIARPPFDAGLARLDFPLLQQHVHGIPLVWLDNAATTQKPRSVIDRITRFYTHENSNVHRGAHALAACSTEAYEHARATVARFVHANGPEEIIFVRGATEGINLVAQTWGRRHIARDDEIVVTELEHHANIVPWQLLCQEKGAHLRVAPIDDDGELIVDEFAALLGPRTRLVSLPHVSNALGTVTPVRELIDLAHGHGARVLVDGAQAISHMPVDVSALGADFYAFSGHKVFGPTGIGVLHATLAAQEECPPWQGGGSMIQEVTFGQSVYRSGPARFEAGTGNIAGAVGLGAAFEYLEGLGMTGIARHEDRLIDVATRSLRTVRGLRLIGNARHRAGAISFVVDGWTPQEVGAFLDARGIAVRAGHHCAQPVLRHFGLAATVRPSFALYNTVEDIERLVAALHELPRRAILPRDTPVADVSRDSTP